MTNLIGFFLYKMKPMPQTEFVHWVTSIFKWAWNTVFPQYNENIANCFACGLMHRHSWIANGFSLMNLMIVKRCRRKWLLLTWNISLQLMENNLKLVTKHCNHDDSCVFHFLQYLEFTWNCRRYYQKSKTESCTVRSESQ